MATEKKYLAIKKFNGVNRAISERDSLEFANTLENFDTNIEVGKLISRGDIGLISAAAANIDKFVNYRDIDWGRDVLIVYDKDGTAADRDLYVFTKTLGASATYVAHSTPTYNYGSLRFGDNLQFLVHRNGVRIGTGTAATNRAMFAGYINREVDSAHDAMFNDVINFSDFFLLKQQWVQQSSFVNHGKIIYDSTRAKYYVLSTAGLEIRDTDFYIERILNDVVVERVGSGGTDTYHGGLALTGNSLYVVGNVPGTEDYKLILYDLSDDLTIDASATLSSAFALGVATNGTLVWITRYDGADGYIDEYSADLASSNTRYTGSGDKLFGITYDTTYVYACDYTNSKILRMPIAAPYTPVDTLSTAAGPLDIVHYNGVLYFIRPTVVYSTPTTGFPTTITTEYTDATQTNEFISFIGAVPYLSQRSGRIVKFDNGTDFNIAGYIPTKIAMGNTTSSSNADTYFYGVSLVDIYGQESHLHRGCVVNGSANTPGVHLTISVNVDSERFAEMTSPSTSVDAALSVWNEFRRIKAIRVYRAYNEDSQASEPTTAYNFLREIDINDSSWTQVSANVLYTFAVWDGVNQADISTVTYEESSGLPESFKPYYTNWQYGIEFEDRYYYGNVRTDELNPHEIVQTPIDAPDVAYQHSENIDYFHPDDGDEIKGFATVWNRYIAFKGHRCIVYNELNKENGYDIGVSAVNAIVTHNNVVYFIYGNGIYALTPSGYQRISMPVDELLASETLTTASAVYYKNKRKIWFHASASKSYLFNHDEGTWDVYDVNNGAAFNFPYIGLALDNKIFGSNDVNDKVYEFDSSVVGATPDMTVKLTTNDIPLGDSFLNYIVTRLFVTFHSDTASEGLTVAVYWLNEDGWHNKSYTFASSGTSNETKTKYITGVRGQILRFVISEDIADRLLIDSIGVEYLVQKYDRILNVST